MIDLHTHTFLSDGDLGPAELVWRAEHAGYRAIGITDHADASNLDDLISKIVQFARDLRAAGKSIAEAAAQAAQTRFRPILMTSFAFILGVLPLVIASGAGAASRRALGTAVFGGMIASTLLAIFYVPVFYVICQSLAERWSRSRKHSSRSPSATAV